MADDGRRTSSRATKGQHTKAHDLDMPVETKKRSGGKKNAKEPVEEEEEDEVIRCVCGVDESGEEDPDGVNPWIACDKCGVWQHNICVGISTFDEDIPESYMCEECDPSAHKELLSAIARGQKPWEARRRKHQTEKGSLKKKAKKLPKKVNVRPNDTAQSEASSPAVNTKAKSSTPLAAEQKKPVKRETPVPMKKPNVKRTREESQENDAAKGPPQKRRVSEQEPSHNPTPPESPPPTVKLKDLSNERQKLATMFKKGLTTSIPISIKKGIYAVRKGDTTDAKAERLAVEIEEAIYNGYANSKDRVDKFRTVQSNLKINQELCDRLLTQDLTPLQLSRMSTDEMASTKLKEETARMKELADRQAVMVNDNGPRIRRTHKGEEIIEGDDTVMEDTGATVARRRSMLDPNADMGVRSRENSPGDDNEVELPADVNGRSYHGTEHESVPKPPLNIQTKSHQARKPSTTQDNFDIQKVFQSVQSPTLPHGVQQARQVRLGSGNNALPVDGPGDDPEIDKMLQDDDAIESPPYSPAAYSADPDVMWQGTVTMETVAKFSALAKHVGGGDPTQSTPVTWESILHKDLKMAGRIDSVKANEYLCSLRYDNNQDVIMLAITPTSGPENTGFTDLFNYFNSKKRFGVLTNKGYGNVRDTYLVPVPPGQLPDFVLNIENRIPADRTEPMILVVLAVRNDHPDSQAQERQQQSYHQRDGSNDTPNAGHGESTTYAQRQMSVGGGGPQMSPLSNQQQFFQSPSPAGPPPGHETPRVWNQEQQRMEDQQRGEQAARRILGDHIHDPTVTFLMPQAFQMRELEWEAIRNILERDHLARVDLQHLSKVLEKSHEPQPQPQQQQQQTPVQTPAQHQR